MKKYKVVGVQEDNVLILSTNGRFPSICRICIRHVTDDGLINLNVDWVQNGRYTRGHRKKMISRVLNSLIKSSLLYEKRKQASISDA